MQPAGRIFRNIYLRFITGLLLTFLVFRIPIRALFFGKGLWKKSEESDPFIFFLSLKTVQHIFFTSFYSLSLFFYYFFCFFILLFQGNATQAKIFFQFLFLDIPKQIDLKHIPSKRFIFLTQNTPGTIRLT